MSITETELQSAIANNLDMLPQGLVLDDGDDESQEGACVVLIHDVLGDFCEQTGAQFG